MILSKEVIIQLQKHPNLIEPLNKRIKEILAEGMKATHQDTSLF
jgi:hypothetical protein